MYIKHNGDKAKLRILSFILQRQRIRPNFITDNIRIFIHTKQKAQPEQPKQRNQTYKHNLNNQNREIKHTTQHEKPKQRNQRGFH